MRASDPALVVEDVTAGYGGQHVLDGVRLSVAAGEVVGLVGPNGSGKTTLLRVASGTLPPERGRVLVMGRDVAGLRARDVARLVAVVPQEMTPAFTFTALEIVLMGRSPHRAAGRGDVAEDYRRARAAMEAVGVLHLGDRPLEELSGGEKQRVVLAQALAQDAPILLLDEPTTHLDLRHVLGSLETIRDLARAGRAVAAVFHDLTLASAYCDRLVALSRGRLVADGAPERVVTPPFLRSVYGVEADVFPHPLTGRPTVLPGGRVGPSPSEGPVVHVVGGAGRGGPVMRALAGSGHDVTVGVLHATDTDAVVAERMNLERLVVPPFSEIDADSEREAVRMMARASIVVVCDAPYGPGNIGNLRAAASAAEAGARVVLLEQVRMADRDFTGGEATRLWERLATRATVARSYEELAAVFDRGGFDHGESSGGEPVRS